MFFPLKYWSSEGSTKIILILRRKVFSKKHTCANNIPFSIIRRHVPVACFIVCLNFFFRKIYHFKEKEIHSFYLSYYDVILMHLQRNYFLCTITLKLHHNYHNFLQCTNLHKTKPVSLDCLILLRFSPADGNCW